MANQNDILNMNDNAEDELTNIESLEELESKLYEELEENSSELEQIKEDFDKIGNPDALGEVITNVVWEQFINQIAGTAGEDFIEENRGLTLDLRKEAHIQTTEAFAKGQIAKHNTEIDYQQRYDDWQSKLKKDGNGNVETHMTRSGKEEATLAPDARKPFDKGRPTGSKEKKTAMDHTIPAAEIIRDPAANAHLTKEEQIAFANGDANLNEMDSSMNQSKGDKSMTEWLDTPNAKGQKPDEIFDITPEEDAALREKDAAAREEYERLKKEGEQRSIEAGKKSRRAEAKRIGGKAVRAVVMTLLASFLKELVAKFVKWLKSMEKSIQSFLASMKEAINSFVNNLKTHLINATDSLLTTIATAIFGPIVGTIKKVWMLLKQGWRSLKDAIQYIKDPANKNKSTDILILEVGKIVMAGATAVGAIVLGELIEKALMGIPVMAVDIPIIGSLANILGSLLGAVIAGIIGAVVMNLIDKGIAERRKRNNQQQQIEKGNVILQTQSQLLYVQQARSNQETSKAVVEIADRHEKAGAFMHSLDHEESIDRCQEKLNDFDEMTVENESGLDDIESMLNTFNN